MKVLYFTSHLSCGGCPQFILKRIQSLVNDADIYLIEYHDYGKLFPTQRNQIKSILQDRFYSLGKDKMEALEILNNIKPDIIHLDEMPEVFGNDDLFKKIYSNDRTWRLVETCHSSQFNPDEQKRFHPDLYSFCTSWHEDIFANMESQFVTIPYPIDFHYITYLDKIRAREKLGINDGKIHVLNVGIWTPGKAQDDVIEIARKYPEMQFDIVGARAGNFQFFWEPLMNNLPDNVKIWDERDDVGLFMMTTDIFLFPSKLELNPLVIREALSFGLPIVGRNLPQYAGMYDLLPLDTNLRNIDKDIIQTKSYNTSEAFSLLHKIAYTKILEKPILKQKISITQHFVDGAFLEIKGLSDSDFKVKFYDEQGRCHYENTIKANCWVRLNRQYYIKWTAKVWQDGNLIYKNTLDLTNKTVFIVLDSKSLGDTIAWSAYALEFQKKHDCQVVLSTYWNHILDYPELELVEPGTTVNCYALYRIGWKWDDNKEPVLCNTIPLQQAATNILGLDYKPLRPKINHSNQFRIPSWKYVAIATNSTMECKFWTREGWQEVINYMHELGYDVYNISKEDNPFDNCTKIDDTSIENTMDVIAGAKLFIGLSSGLSWLAWALNQNIVMISNFTESDHEFDCHRITKPDVCHGCWNDANIKLDPHWLWCPRNKDFECQRTIPASMVIDAIKKAGI